MIYLYNIYISINNTMNNKSFFNGYEPPDPYAWMERMSDTQKQTIMLCRQMEHDIEHLQLELKRLQIELEELRNEKTT